MMRLKLLSCRYLGEKVHHGSLCPLQPRLVQSVRKSTCKSSLLVQNKTTNPGESRQRWSGWQHRLHCGNPVHKIPPTRSRGVFFFSTFLWPTKLLSNTHSQHPAAARKEWSLLKCSSSLCVPVSRLWMPSVLCMTRDLSTNGHRLCGSDRHTVCALTLSNPELN